jgi:hypothetical protein
MFKFEPRNTTTLTEPYTFERQVETARNCPTLALGPSKSPDFQDSYYAEREPLRNEANSLEL